MLGGTEKARGWTTTALRPVTTPRSDSNRHCADFKNGGLGFSDQRRQAAKTTYIACETAIFDVASTVPNGVLPARVQEIAEVTTMRVEPEFFVPPTPGALARRAAGPQ
jgi:hypothetical protein